MGDNRRTASDNHVLHPFWVPARLTAAGTLLPPTENEPLIPWLVREVLEPADRNYPVLSNVEALNAELALWNWKFATATWPSYWTNAEAFYGRVCATAGWPADRVHLGNWVADRNFTITLPPARGMSAGVMALYSYLEKQPVLLRLLATVLQGRPPGVPLHPTDSAMLLTKGHYGQMSDKFPLSSSQRFTLQALLTTAPGDVFPVNGPPGTGKTTLLQSVVANLVVEKALLGAEAASSTNNQAITNILDSFGREARVDRWVPGLASLGLYLTNNEPTRPNGVATRCTARTLSLRAFSNQKKTKPALTCGKPRRSCCGTARHFLAKTCPRRPPYATNCTGRWASTWPGSTLG